MSTLCEKRLAVCKNCVLYKRTWDGGVRCDSSKYANENGTEYSYLPKKGWVRGCNCRIDIACNNPDKHCVLGLW